MKTNCGNIARLIATLFSLMASQAAVAGFQYQDTQRKSVSDDFTKGRREAVVANPGHKSQKLRTPAPRGRDLLRLEAPVQINKGPMIVANPLFYLNQNARTQKSPVATPFAGVNSSNRRSLDFTALAYPPLPGTMAEATTIKGLLTDAQLLIREQPLNKR